jgi:sec-independent protein translocase protein TatB
VLGPEKLPRVVAEVGRWVGRARAMARQFREQLEEEVQLEQARRAQAQTPPAQAAGTQTPPPAAAEVTPTAAPEPAAPEPAAPEPAAPELPPTYSHAHPTDATGASTLAAGTASPTPSADERGT